MSGRFAVNYAKNIPFAGGIVKAGGAEWPVISGEWRVVGTGFPGEVLREGGIEAGIRVADGSRRFRPWR